MNDKQDVLDVLNRLPDDASIELIREELECILDILEGQRDIAEGRTHSHEEVMEMARQCLSDYVGRRAPASN